MGLFRSRSRGFANIELPLVLFILLAVLGMILWFAGMSPWAFGSAFVLASLFGTICILLCFPTR